MPADAPLGTGVDDTVQCAPKSRVWKTREDEPPPEAIQASPPCPGAVTRQVPLAANANSPSSAGGIPAVGASVQERPPSFVDRMRNLPPTGSDRASPWRRSKKATQS